jgi:hypothetical protein
VTHQSPNTDTSDRGVATQIDFLIAVVIIIGAITVYYLGALILFESQVQGDESNSHAGLRAEDRIADDILINGSDHTLLDSNCSRAFFSAEGDSGCNLSDPGDGQTYLRGVVGLGNNYNLNVTVTDGEKIINVDPSGGSDPFEHRIGDPVPTAEGVVTYQRVLSYGRDVTGDGDIDYFRVNIHLWGGNI